MTAARRCSATAMPADPLDVGDGTAAVGAVALPLVDAPAMVTFYRALGLEVTETPLLIQVRLGPRTVNFHRPELLLVGFRLRAPATTAPVGDVRIAWEGSTDDLERLLDDTGAEIVECAGGGGAAGTGRYVRDPDGNLLEILIRPGAAPGPDDGGGPSTRGRDRPRRVRTGPPTDVG